MLKMTGVKLEQISDIGIFLLIEKGLRGGISYICKRFSNANNKYMKNYDPKKLSKYTMYFDATSLYGWETSRYFLYGVFKLLKMLINLM